MFDKITVHGYTYPTMSTHISVPFFKKIAAEFKTAQEEKKRCDMQADEALHMAKRAIFSVHRGDLKQAEQNLHTASELLKKLLAKKASHLKGPVAAACEECAEAYMTLAVAKEEKIKAIDGIQLSAETYLAALCDVVGELVRMATSAAIKKNLTEVKRVHAAAQDIMEQLYALDMTGYTRQKFDQAKGHMRKLEHMVYEVTLRM